jgi:transposase
LVAAEFADPARLAALGSTRFIRFGATRGVQIRRPVADKLLQAARDALPTTDASVARAVPAADLALLDDLDAQVDQATEQLARLLPKSPFAPLLTVPGWGSVRAGNYGGALGDPARFDNHRQIYRTAGLNPIQYESAGKRRDSVISREGSVELRRALMDLGVGLWLSEPTAKVYGSQLRARGKKGLVIAMADAAKRYAATSLAPGSFALAAARTKPDDPPTGEVAYVSVGARHPSSQATLDQHAPPPAPAAESMKRARPRT